MGNYNPHQPYILGEEWVPIRNEDTVIAPDETTVELGHRFTVVNPVSNLFDGRFYIKEMPADYYPNYNLIALYAAGTADQSGPIREVVIPVDTIALTGTAQNSGGAPNGATGLLTPQVDYYYSVSTASVPNTYGMLWLTYNTAPYAQLLQGKRILGVDVLLGMSSTSATNSESTDFLVPSISLTPTATFSGTTSSALATGRVQNVSRVAFGGPTFAFRLGNSAYWSANVSLATQERLPWTFDDINFFDATAGGGTRFVCLWCGTQFGDPAGQSFELWYSALRVTYCEEKRLIVGSWNSKSPAVSIANYGANVARMRSWQAKTVNPTLAAGTYDMTLSSMNSGDFDAFNSLAFDSGATLYSTRELYQNPAHPGIQVNVPFPPEDNLGSTLTTVDISTLVQLSLHTSGSGVLTEPHVYGSNLAAQVWGINTATQDVYDTGVTARSYPWVRFYARRFGDTTIPLTITGVGGLSGSTASISVAEFDALEEIVDGWKEISLRFNTPPTMGGASPAWTWSAAAETSGNRWEVLGCAAPAISGLPGNLFGQAFQQLGAATYQPNLGATVDLTWMPQGVTSPYVSGAAADNASDAVLIFSLDPPAVSGFSASVLSQPVTGIGQNCGLNPCGIPTGIDYVNLTWTSISGLTLPSSGFGYYEIQRSDPVTDWQSIMQGSAITGTNFKDYEARTDTVSSYRIRSVNSFGFYSAWSSTITATLGSPALSGSCLTNAHVMIFTSNEAQNGRYNLAYSMAWDDHVQEDFAFPEADSVTYQAMYGRDFVTAFHPTERGGVVFDRSILVQAAAISPETLEDFTGLRDMAWADLNYVCLRDEDGNRWFVSVQVPTGRVQLYRKLYMANVRIVEVTSTPTPVDPWS